MNKLNAPGFNVVLLLCLVSVLGACAGSGLNSNKTKGLNLTCDALNSTFSAKPIGTVQRLDLDGFSVDPTTLRLDEKWCEQKDVGFRSYLTSTQLNKYIDSSNQAEAWNITTLLVAKLEIANDDLDEMRGKSVRDIADKWIRAAARYAPLSRSLNADTRWVFKFKLDNNRHSLRSFNVGDVGAQRENCVEYDLNYLVNAQVVEIRTSGFLCNLKNTDSEFAIIALLHENLAPGLGLYYNYKERFEFLRSNYLLPLMQTLEESS